MTNKIEGDVIATFLGEFTKKGEVNAKVAEVLANAIKPDGKPPSPEALANAISEANKEDSL